MGAKSILDPVDGHMNIRLIRAIMMDTIKGMDDIEFLGINRGEDEDRYSFRVDEIKIVSISTTYYDTYPTKMQVEGQDIGEVFDVHDPKLKDNIAKVIREIIEKARKFEVEIVFNRSGFHARPKKYYR